MPQLDKHVAEPIITVPDVRKTNNLFSLANAPEQVVIELIYN